MAKFNFSEDITSGRILIERIKSIVIEPNTFKKDIYRILNSHENYLNKVSANKFSSTVGYLAGTIVDGKLCISISFCDPEDYYIFNVNKGKNIACSNALKNKKVRKMLSTDKIISDNYNSIFYYMPYSLKEYVDKFTKRCEKYFKVVENE